MVTGSALCGQYLKCLKEILQIHQPLSCYCERWYPFLAHIANMWSADKIRFCTLQKGYQYIFNWTWQSILLHFVCRFSTWIKSTTSRESWRLDSRAFWELYCTRHWQYCSVLYDLSISRWRAQFAKQSNLYRAKLSAALWAPFLNNKKITNITF